ncbi:YciI family protein [Jatrophihabitans sp. YIM 134969]
MTTYLLAIQQPDGLPDAATLTAAEERLHALNEDLRAAGAWVFTGGLEPPAAALTARPDGVVTDGPYVESKEHRGGIWVISAPDRDAAVSWARRAAEATGLPVEVRAFQDVAPF